MAYRQFTKCTSPGNYIGALAAQIIISAAIGAIPLVMGLVFGALALGPGVLAAMYVPLMAVLAYCRWWLYDRLICLNGDVCAVGTVLGVEPPDEKSGFDAFDTDYSINMLLAPHEIGDQQADIENDAFQGWLIKETPEVAALGVEFTGETSSILLSTDPDGTEHWSPKSAVFHAEFEGGGVYDLMLAILVALGWNTAALIAAVIICAIPIIGWIACLIISLIFAAVTAGIVAVGMAVALADQGNPNDVNANLGNIEQGKDILVVKGTWVYDSAHTGWNEAHPIKHCQRIGRWNDVLPDGSPAPNKGPNVFDTWDEAFSSIRDVVPPNIIFLDANSYVSYWCSAINDASDATTIANQSNPSNNWNVHPDIDGCDPNGNGGEVPH